MVQKIYFVLLHHGTFQDGQTKTSYISDETNFGLIPDSGCTENGRHHMFVAHLLMPVGVHLLDCICYDTEIKI